MLRCFVIWIGCLLLGFGSAASAEPLVLQAGDHVCLIGNALGERLQHQNEFESLLHREYPKLELTVRNLCVPGDEPAIRLRSLNFGSPDDHLAFSQADVVVMFFGYNESFRLQAGLDHDAVLQDFEKELTATVRHTLTQRYNGQSAPRVVLVSPIAFEQTDDVNLPTAESRNPALLRITQSIANVAMQCGVTFADLFTPTRQLFENESNRLTIDGGHLNDDGYAALAPILFKAILGRDAQSEPIDPKLLAAIDDKNFHWFNRYRAVNGFSIYGTRGEAGSDGTYRNREVMNRELAILDEMTAIRDQRIWKLAAGESVPETIDDSQTLPFINPKSNVGVENDPNMKQGKLGSLKYLPAEEQLTTFDLSDGMRIQLVASEQQFPELANPVALNFDSKGRLWVSTMPSYPHWKPKTPMDDKLLILTDTDGDGSADECQTFMGGLHQPTGFELGHGGAFIANQQDILFCRDTDGDDVADIRERTLVGFDTADSHHGLAAFDWGPGGDLYFQEGTFKFSQVESPYGLTRLIEGGTWKFNPRTHRFGVQVNYAYSNPWGYCFDDWGQDFIGDASPGFAYFGAPISGRLDFPLKHPGGSQYKRVVVDQGYDNGDVSYPTFYPKRIRPLAGCAFLSSEHFPEEMQGDFLVTNVIGDRAILTHDVREDQSGFVGKENPLWLSGGDGNFRPVDLDIAPDGSVYVIDWHNALIGHLQHNLRDPNRDKSHGRIWRITYPSRPLVQSPNLAETTTDGLVEYLTSDASRKNQRHAYRARRELLDRPTADVIAAVSSRRTAALDSANPDSHEQLDPHDQLELLWLHQSHNIVDADLLNQVLKSTDHRARAAAVRVLTAWMDRLDSPHEMLAKTIADPHPRVRLETVLATTHAIGEPWALPHRDALIRTALKSIDMPMDEYQRYSLNEAMRRFEQVIDMRSRYLPKEETLTATETDHSHHHATSGQSLPVFLDMSPAIVRYQLDRLPTSSLLAIERNATDEKFAALHAAILSRPDVASADRQRALDALIQLQDSDPAAVIVDVITGLDWANSRTRVATQATANGLATLLLRLPQSNLQSQSDRLAKIAATDTDPVAPIAMAALLAAGRGDSVFELTQQTEARAVAWLRGVAMLPKAADRIAQRDRVIELLRVPGSDATTSSALTTLGSIPTNWPETFSMAARYLQNGKLRDAAIQALLKVPTKDYVPEISDAIATKLTDIAERTPAARRTSDAFIDSMQLVDRVLAQVPPAKAKSLRDRLREITVRLIRIRTVAEEMRYDTPYFAVEAGRPVQVVLENPDAMPHNIVFTMPGALKEVAAQGLQVGPRDGWQGKPYVPESPSVLQASGLIGVNEKAVLTFNAPTEPGEYPYVCTFPQHWYRMFGVMVVVDNLEAYNADPKPPADPVGNNRSFVQAWTSDDFAGDLSTQLRGRSPEIGKKVFEEATCASCHQAGGAGGRIGPALDDVWAKWKGDPAEILKEILHPSDRIDPKYVSYLVLTVDGQTLSGILVEETREHVRLLSNAEATEPTLIPQDDIEEMMKTSTSIMPKALLDQYTQDEIYELLSYLQSLKQ